MGQVIAVCTNLSWSIH